MLVPFGKYGAMVSRPAPLHSPGAYVTYGISMPLKTHWRSATCEEAECEAYRSGWVTTCDLATDLGQKQAHYIRQDKSRRNSEQLVTATLVKFVFVPGQKCFRASSHQVPLDRPANFYAAPGNFLARTGQVRIHRSAENWAEDFSTAADRLARQVKG